MIMGCSLFILGCAFWAKDATEDVDINPPPFLPTHRMNDKIRDKIIRCSTWFLNPPLDSAVTLDNPFDSYKAPCTGRISTNRRGLPKKNPGRSKLENGSPLERIIFNNIVTL